MNYIYLIKNVTKEEYDFLKQKSTEILKEVEKVRGKMEYPDIKGKDISLDFKYNKDRNAIGIFVKTGGVEKLLLNGREFTKSEMGELVLSKVLYSSVLEHLDEWKIRNGKWI